MISLEYCHTMAQYNQWMNQKLYAACDTLSEDELRQDRQLFFGSIFGTLNHLMFGDLAWLRRFQGEFDQVPELGVDLYVSYKEMKTARQALDREIQEYYFSFDESELGREFTFTSKSINREITLPLWVAITHMFNHQAHHRGQITSALSQLGLDVGVTDLPVMWMAK